MARWMVAAKKADFAAIAAKYHISPVTARLLRNRDLVTEEEIGAFLHGDLHMLHDPALLPDAQRAAALILQTIAEGGKIRIVGDYDVDGVSSTAIFMRGLTLHGADADYRIPHRVKDGYGINDAIIDEAASDGIALILTCDNGISAAAQVKHASELGLKIIITDHHDVPLDAATRAQCLPEADAVVDPKIRKEGMTPYPFAGICGAVVAYKLLQVMFRMADRAKDRDVLQVMDDLTELCALATVCDVMELKDENRAIAKEGMRRMADSAIPGLKALIEATGLSGKEITTYHLGFVLGPCLNAGGRLTSAMRCAELMLSTDPDAAHTIAAELKALNESRKQLTATYLDEARQMIEDGADAGDKILVVYLPDAHESVAGIVAGRLKEAYARPAIVLTKSEEGIKGSARSIPAYDMFRSLSACADLFTKFGGHPMAAGLSLDAEEKISLLRTRLNEQCTLSDQDFVPTLHLDMELPLSYVSEALLDEWQMLSPFGEGNPRPLFAARDVAFLRGRLLGKSENVGKYTVQDMSGTRYDLMLFQETAKWHDFLRTHFGEEKRRLLYEAYLSPEEAPLIKIAYYPAINEYRGRRSVQLVMEDYQI